MVDYDMWMEVGQDLFFFFSHFFHSFTVRRDIITYSFVQLNVQLDCSRSVKTYIKMLLHVSV